MNISAPSGNAQRISLLSTQIPPTSEAREAAHRASVKDNDADDAATNAAKKAIERPTPPVPSNRSPLADMAGKLVDKLI